MNIKQAKAHYRAERIANHYRAHINYGALRIWHSMLRNYNCGSAPCKPIPDALYAACPQCYGSVGGL